MNLLFVANTDLDDVAGLAEDLAGEARLGYRNPYLFSLEQMEPADKVYIYGKHQAVHDAYIDTDAEVVHLAYTGEQVPAKPDKTPSEAWSKDELVEVARANGINATSRWKKQTILDKLNATDDT